MFEDAREDRGHTAGECRALLFDERAQAFGVQEPPWQQQIAPHHPTCIGDTPRIHVEHRHDAQQPFCVIDAEARPDGERVQVHRTMAVGDTLRIARGAGGVAHRSRTALIDARPFERRSRGGDQVLVRDRLAEAGRLPRADHDHLLHARAAPDDRREERGERVVDDDDAILCVVDDLRELRRWEAKVERVQHRAHAGDREVGLDVLLVVPAERADSISGRDAKSLQCRGQSLHALRDHLVGRVPGALAFERNDLAVRKDVGAAPKERGDAQRHVLHGRVHRLTSLLARSFSRAQALGSCRKDGLT